MSGKFQETEDFIANYTGADDGGTTTDTTDTGSVDTGSTEVTSSDSVAGGNDSVSGASNDTATGGANEGQTQQAQQTQQRANPGDLVDPRTGQVIARAGAERRHYVRAEKLNQENSQLKQQLQIYEAQNRFAKEQNLTPQDQLMGFQLVAALKKDPIETIKFLLTEAKAKGHNIEGLSNGAIDTAAVTKALKAELAPLTQRQKLEHQQQQALQSAQQEWENFTVRYPNAELHEEFLVALLTEDKQMSIHDAYVTLVQYAASNGYNINQPLGPQIQARKNGQQQQATQQPQQKPLPHSRGNGGTTQQNARTADTADQLYSENTSWRTALKNSMREAGFNLED